MSHDPNLEPQMAPVKTPVDSTNDELYAVVEDPKGETVQFEIMPLAIQPSDDESQVAAYYISIKANPDGVAPGTDVENYERGQEWLREHPLDWRLQVEQE